MAEADPTLGPRFGGLYGELTALTLGFRYAASQWRAFVPFERLSTGERYALSFALAKDQLNFDCSPILIMEEPETALHPSAIGKMLRALQTATSTQAPQAFVTTHSESALRYFTTDCVFLLGTDRIQRQLWAIIKNLKPVKAKTEDYEYLIRPGGPSALLAEKVLLVEGSSDALVLGSIDQLSATYGASSFSLSGWSLLEATKADHCPDYARLLIETGKTVAVLYDADDAGLKAAEETKDTCLTFVYQSTTEAAPELEEALLLGLPSKERERALSAYRCWPECSSCPKNRTSCWRRKKQSDCDAGEAREKRKQRLQKICIASYRESKCCPPAFQRLVQLLDTAKPGAIHRVEVDP